MVKSRKKIIRTISCVLALMLAFGMGLTALADRSGTVKGSNVNARTGAGTNFDYAAKGLSNGTAVTVTGEEAGSDGHTWYKVTFSDGKEGYIRDDFINVGEEIQEEAPADTEMMTEGDASEGEGGATMAETPTETEPEPEVSVPNDYTVEYSTDSEGTGTWYLNNNIEGVRYKVEELLSTAQSAEKNKAESDANNGRNRLFIIILSVLLIVAVVAITILIIRLRSMYEDIEEEQYRSRSSSRREGSSQRSSQSGSRTGGSRSQASSQSLRTTSPSSRGESSRGEGVRGESSRGEASRSGVRTESRNAGGPTRTAREVRYQERPQSQASRKPAPRPKNFAGDIDDDFEFNFVNLDDDI